MPSDEMLDLARKAIERIEAEKRMLIRMTPQERDAYIKEWSARIGAELAEAGEYCPCCRRTAGSGPTVEILKRAVVEHCSGSACSYSFSRKCICICVKCEDAKKRDV